MLFCVSLGVNYVGYQRVPDVVIEAEQSFQFMGGMIVKVFDCIFL